MEYTATDDSFKEDVKEGTVLVDFWATWCGPCRMQAPILEQLADEFDESELKIVKMDIDENPETPKGYGVMAIPTLLFLKNGELAKQVTGVHTKQQIKDILQEIA